MSQVMCYEVEVQTNGRWRTLQSFDPHELAEAKSTVERLRKNPIGSGVQLVQETLEDDGLFKRRILIFKRFETPAAPVMPGTPATNGDGATRPAPAKANQEQGVCETPRAKSWDDLARQRKKSRTDAMRALLGKALMELLWFLYVPVETDGADGRSGNADAHKLTALQPTKMRGQVAAFDDEMSIPPDELAIADSTYQQLLEFLRIVSDYEHLRSAKRDPEFARKVTVFAIGALLSVEKDIDLFSERGKSVVTRTLRFFMDGNGISDNVVEAMEEHLSTPDAPDFILLGSRCFGLYQAADLRNLRQELANAFGISDRDLSGIGKNVTVGILFTHVIANPETTSETDDDASRQVVDHHEATVLDMCRRFAGRKVKHLGDGLMLSFANNERMVACAVALVDVSKRLANRPDEPQYRIRCGGHFGEAIAKDEQFFGSTVQFAARVTAQAGSNQACFSTVLFDRDLPTFEKFQSMGVADLKGVSKPVALAAYG